MKQALLFVFLLSSIFIKAQDNPAAPNNKMDTIHSTILKEDRFISVRMPDRVKDVSSLPVIYILDGQVLFNEAVNIINRLNKETGKNAIIVGIGNIWERDRDYTPTYIVSSPWTDSQAASISGGGEKFISFLQNELFPYIFSKYTVSSTRILIGHSLGGLEAMNISLKHTGMFNFYASIDPSMWWDDKKLLSESKTILSDKALENKTLFLAVANTKDMDMSVLQVKADTSAKTILIRPSLILVDYINSNKQTKLRFEWKFYKEYHHMTVSTPAIYDALKFFLASP
jgi:predicted alpha/beta superfamily hydrolase